MAAEHAVDGSGGAGGGLEDVAASVSATGARRALSALKLKFISYVKALVADMVKAFPGDPIVGRVQSQVTACAEIKPEKIIYNIGDVLFGFHKPIYDRDASFFLKQTFKTIASGASNQDHAKSGIHIADRVRELYTKLPEPRRKGYLELLVTMTDTFLEIADLSEKLAR
jgi:hypothetical protein